jgi:hypothetical protein
VHESLLGTQPNVGQSARAGPHLGVEQTRSSRIGLGFFPVRPHDHLARDRQAHGPAVRLDGGLPAGSGCNHEHFPTARVAPGRSTTMELKMRLLLIAVVAAALAWAPTFAVAQMKNPPKNPGQSEYAPGQRADQPGEAKKYAPGQRRHKKDNPKYPGASEYAPGQQRK